MVIDTKRKNKAYGINNALQKLSPIPILANRKPVVTDKNFSIGQIWIDQPNDDSYILTSIINNQAQWQPTSSNTAGSAPITKYVVAKDGSAGYTTIQSALDAANAAGGGMIYVRPGIYTENLICYDKTQVIGTTAEPESSITKIIGVHTPSVGSGEFTFANLYLTNTIHIFSSTVAGTGILKIKNCIIDVGNGYTFNLPNWANALELINCDSLPSTHNGCILNTGGCSVRLIGSRCGDGTAHNMIISGPFEIRECEIRPQITFQGNAGITFKSITNTKFLHPIITANTAQMNIIDCYFDVGSNIALNHNSTGIITFSETTIDSSSVGNILQGTGTIDLGSITFVDQRGIAATLTINKTSVVVCGNIEGSTLRAGADQGGISTFTGITNVTSGVVSGAGSVIMNSINPANSSGWLKIYIGTDARYIPYWTTNTP